MGAYYEFKLPAKILSGSEALEHIPHELNTLGAFRPLLLSDQGLEKRIREHKDAIEAWKKEQRAKDSQTRQ